MNAGFSIKLSFLKFLPECFCVECCMPLYLYWGEAKWIFQNNYNLFLYYHWLSVAMRSINFSIPLGLQYESNKLLKHIDSKVLNYYWLAYYMDEFTVTGRHFSSGQYS